MDAKIRRPIYVFLLGLFAAVAGCAHLTQHHCEQDKTEIPQQFLDVGGAVEHPQRLTIPEEGLVLRQAIIMAGGLRSSAADALHPSEAFVALQRGSGVSARSFYFPLQLVETDLAGEVPVLHGDTVQILDVRRTSLFSNASAGGTATRFVVNGLVNRPGQYQMGEALSRLQRKQGPAIGVIGEAAQLATGEAVGSQSTIIVVRRSGPGGLGEEQFVLPKSGTSVELARGGEGVATTAAQRPTAPPPPPPADATLAPTFVAPATPRSFRTLPLPAVAPPAATPAAGNAQPLTAALPGPVPPAQGNFAPAATSQQKTKDALSARIQHGDEITLTRLEAVPVVVGGLLAGQLQQQRAEARRASCLGLHAQTQGAQANQPTGPKTGLGAVGQSFKDFGSSVAQQLGLQSP